MWLGFRAGGGFTGKDADPHGNAHAQLGNKGFGEPLTFDNTYYTALLAKPWEDPGNEMRSMIGLPSDHVLPDDRVCRPAIEAYAQSQQAFFSEFSDAYRKLTSLGAQWT